MRNFFFAHNKEEIQQAVTELAAFSHTPLPANTDWFKVEADFKRLFSKPTLSPAPPYASAYINENSTKTSAALEIQNFYSFLGVKAPDSQAVDHLSHQLNAYILLLKEQANRPRDQNLKNLQKKFIQVHLEQWLPKFISAMRQEKDLPLAITMVTNSLESWFKAEKIALTNK
ncbi:molecular chaperone TorD family protein [Desulfotalea psychrophila]|uniref:molecular chaperone TorD family protein n=1 Tax=Desulfotalea psychrophila TaxID=84980 RepID=UPI0002E2D6E4|nr:molecular chaperone TorD family protein [Desulfotalea psychrophila]